MIRLLYILAVLGPAAVADSRPVRPECEWAMLVSRARVAEDVAYRATLREAKVIFAAYGVILRHDRRVARGSIGSADVSVKHVYYRPPRTERLTFARKLLARARFVRSLDVFRDARVAVDLVAVHLDRARARLTPPADDGGNVLLRKWRHRSDRRDLAYFIEDDETSRSFARTEVPNVILNARLLQHAHLFDRLLFHESQHAAHGIDGEIGRNILFRPHSGTTDGRIARLPGLPGNYGLGMISGEFEAQTVSAIDVHLDLRNQAWEHLLPYIDPQLEWLRQLERELADKPVRRLECEIEVGPDKIRIDFPKPKPGVAIDPHVRQVLRTRIRHLGNIHGIRSKAARRDGSTSTAVFL